MPDSFTFTPASQVTERHALVVALEAPPNAGKTYSGLRLCKGMADAQGKRVAVIDTEGGRTLHLRKKKLDTDATKFDFDVTMMGPPHRPEKYLEAASIAQAKGYGAVLIDSFSNVWRGIGGVLHWADEELDAYVERQRELAESKGWRFDEGTTRFKGKQSSLIRPKTAFKYMMAGLLDLRIPIVLSIRGEQSYDPDSKKELFKTHMQKNIGFDVTCRFRLMPDRKGIIDISDSEKFKMEGDHAAIFKNGEQLSERHGAALEAWARNADYAPADKVAEAVDRLIDRVKAATDEASLAAVTSEEKTQAWIGKLLDNRKPEHDRLYAAINARRASLQAEGL